jgi:hypothetical protein
MLETEINTSESKRIVRDAPLDMQRTTGGQQKKNFLQLQTIAFFSPFISPLSLLPSKEFSDHFD